jgi:hypothetical protein
MIIEMMEDGAFGGVLEFRKSKFSASEQPPGKVSFQLQAIHIIHFTRFCSNLL